MTNTRLAKLLAAAVAAGVLIGAPATALGETSARSTGPVKKCAASKQGQPRGCGAGGSRRHTHHKRRHTHARGFWLTFDTDETETAPRNGACVGLSASCPVHRPIHNEWAVHSMVRLKPAAHGRYAGHGALKWDIFRFHEETDNVCAGQGGTEKHDGTRAQPGALTVGWLKVAHAGAKHPKVTLDLTVPQLIEHYRDTWPSCEGGAPTHDNDLWSTQLVDIALVDTGLSKLGITRGYARDPHAYNGIANELTIVKFDGPRAAPKLDAVATKQITYEDRQPADDLKVWALIAIYDHKPLTLPPLS